MHLPFHSMHGTCPFSGVVWLFMSPAQLDTVGTTLGSCSLPLPGYDMKVLGEGGEVSDSTQFGCNLATIWVQFVCECSGQPRPTTPQLNIASVQELADGEMGSIAIKVNHATHLFVPCAVWFLG